MVGIEDNTFTVWRPNGLIARLAVKSKTRHVFTCHIPHVEVTGGIFVNGKGYLGTIRRYFDPLVILSHSFDLNFIPISIYPNRIETVSGIASRRNQTYCLWYVDECAFFRNGPCPNLFSQSNWSARYLRLFNIEGDGI